MFDRNETIAAIATARGRAALAIVRLSGPEAVPIGAACFRGADLLEAAPNTVHFGYVVSPEHGDIDQVVATVFRAPRSSTGEDVVEFTCHGGDLAPQQVLSTLLQAGARLAEPGEYTQRAFVNGKIDLAQAEAVADLIHASSTLAHRVSLGHLEGRYSERLHGVAEGLLNTVALVELELDFSDEDVEFASADEVRAAIDRTLTVIDELLASYRLGTVIRDGVRVVIAGRPNSGKSSLLNAILGRDRAIVSPIPGTTRDEIEADIEIDGILFRFVDTAGLRTSEDVIEAEGVRRALRSMEGAGVVVYLYDLTVGLTEEERETIAGLGEIPVVVVGNKADLAAFVSPDPGIYLSARRAMTVQEELNTLLSTIKDSVETGQFMQDASTVVMNERHLAHLRRAKASLGRSLEALASGASGEVLSAEIRRALDEIGHITGEVTNEDVLGQIFSRFCIGK